MLHPVIQNTPPWLALRATHFTASEAPAALGVSRYVKRSDLLRQKATGLTDEPDSVTQALFAQGHEAEAAARPLAEKIVGEDFYAVTVTDEIDGLPLLASMDGLTMDETTAWETKLWNEELAASVRAGALPEHYTVQMDQQLMVSGATRCLFTCSDGTPERTVSCWYETTPEKRAKLIAGWKQFKADLDAYAPPEAEPPKPTGRAPQSLPALRLDVTGAVTASNLGDFKANALSLLAGINRDLQTDADFADAEQTVKWCGDVEARIKATKDHALSQTASIEEAFRVLDDVSAEVRRVRLDLGKLVETEKKTRRAAIVTDGIAAFRDHIAGLNTRLGANFMPDVPADFAGAIKGTKNLDSMRDAVATELARAKIAANEIADRIQINLAALREREQLAFLFPDVRALVMKAPDDLRAIIAARISELEAKERARLEAEREKIRAEEQAVSIHAPQVARPEDYNAAAPRVAANDPPEKPTLRLHQINERLAPITLSADGLEALGFPVVATEKAAKLYRERDFPAMCDAIVRCVVLAKIPAQTGTG